MKRASSTTQQRGRKGNDGIMAWLSTDMSHNEQKRSSDGNCLMWWFEAAGRRQASVAATRKVGQVRVFWWMDVSKWLANVGWWYPGSLLALWFDGPTCVLVGLTGTMTGGCRDEAAELQVAVGSTGEGNE